jgi:hypothetical protein
MPPERARLYLGTLAPAFVNRALSAEEQRQVLAAAAASIPKILAAWKSDAGLATGARLFLESRLSTGGSKAELDHALPGLIAAHVAKNKLPWSEILTSETCYDRADRPIPCDTGAPYGAGVLATRAFLAANVSRFNLSRAKTMLAAFLCETYPMADALEPRLDKASLIPMFRADNPQEQTDERAVNGFGNGFGCYACHGQFGAHAQLFVKFDGAGLWKKDATGLQDPKGELGRSSGGLMASHLMNPADARLERTRVLGKPVDNLAEAARRMADSALFVPCAAEQILRYGLDLDQAVELAPAALAALVERARLGAAAPTFGDLVYAAFVDPWVVRSFASSLPPGGAR